MGFLPTEQYNEVFSKVPRLCVDLLIRYEGKYLLTRRVENPGAGKWHIPGGRVHFGESVMEAISRVSMRELGFVVAPHKMMGYIEIPQEEGRGMHSVSLVFLCNVADKKFDQETLTDKMCFVDKVPEDILPEHAGFLNSVI